MVEYDKKRGMKMIRSISVNDVEMEYYSFGRGERAFVILPGLGVKSVLLSAKAVEAGYSCFAEEYTVYLFERRKNMPADYSIRQMARDTAAVMEELGLRGADVFGASLGGMIAMCLAIEFPHLVRRLVPGSTAARVSPEAAAGIERWIALAQANDMTALTADFIDNLYSEKTLGQYRELLFHMNDDATARDIERFIIQAKAIPGFDVLDELSKIICPTLVIGVEGDRVIPPSCSREIADGIGCELFLYGEEYGHCVFDEALDYKQRLLDFFHS